MNDISQKLANWSTVGAVVLASVSIVISVKSCSHGNEAIRQANEANELSKSSNDRSEKANELAQEANTLVKEQIQRGAGSVAPYLHVEPFEKEVSIRDLGSLKTARLGMTVHNIGKEPIDMVRVQIFGIFQWVDDGPPTGVASDSPVKRRQHDYNFPEIVRTAGMAQVDLKKPLLEMIQQLQIDGKTLETEHAVTFNLKFSGRLVGMDQPTSHGINEEVDPNRRAEGLEFLDLKDRDTITIKWTPAAVATDDAKQHIAEYQPWPWVSN